MTRRVDRRELLIGIEGLALLRHLYDGSDEDSKRRVAEVRSLLEGDNAVPPEAIDELDARSGYGLWSGRYDEPGNPVVGLEEPAVRSLVDPLPPGRALDAACGTGRHSRHLLELGHQVVGFDLTHEMLTRARRAAAGAGLLEADLGAIPLASGTFDVVVCGLALAHVAELRAAAAELARVLAPGGHLVVSALHPFQALLGWHAPFEDEGGGRHFVREHGHTHADYFSAFGTAGLTFQRCLEPALTPAQVAAKRRAYGRIPEAALAAYVGLPAVLVLAFAKP
ncbi:MAG: class I SAM-dependent methyltransferase [Candidatus Dormiibacterota bacterium]